MTSSTPRQSGARGRGRVFDAITGGGSARSVLDTPPLRWDHYRALLEAIPAITYVQRVDASVTTVYVSPQVEAITGWKPEDYRARAGSWFDPIHPDDQGVVNAAVNQALAMRTALDITYRVLTPDGGVVWLRDRGVLIESTDDVHTWQGVQLDVTAEKASEEELHRLAYFDALTGLPNRRLCLDRIRAELDRAGREAVALLFLDLDRFKVINDGIGHAAGDELLVAVAQRLTPYVAGRGSLARYGGDEFVALLDGFASPAEVASLAESLVAALRRPFLVRGYELVVEGTIGIAVSSPEISTPEQLLSAADVALYRAKAAGGSTYAIFDPESDRGGLDRLEHEADLRRGLEAREFQIAYQPVVAIQTGQILAVEALLRWNHPRRGVLAPSEFIALADETGVIVPLGKWVIEEACLQVRAWQDRFPSARGLQLSVNLSGRQFQTALAADVASALERSGLPPSHLALELREGDVLTRVPAVRSAIQELKQLGVKVTIDDFGAGWSALTSLTDFTVDDLKIDGSRVSRLGHQPQDVDVVRALVGMAKAIGLDVTAEAVETGEQLALLRELGCDRAQGHHFAPPLFVAEIEALFSRESNFVPELDSSLP